MQAFTVYSTDEIIKIKIEGLTLSVSPLTYKQKDEIQSLFMNGQALEGAVTSMRYAIKDIEGLKNSDGSKFELKTKAGVIDDRTVDMLLNAPFGTKMNLVCVSLLNGIPSQFLHPETGKPLEGVSFVESRKATRKK